MLQDDMFQELAVHYWESDWELFAFQAVFELVTAEHCNLTWFYGIDDALADESAVRLNKHAFCFIQMPIDVFNAVPHGRKQPVRVLNHLD